MYAQQVGLLINLLMLLEGVLVVFAGYLAYHLKQLLSDHLWSMDPTVFLGTILFLMFVHNFLAGSLGLYSDRRVPSMWFILRRLFIVIVLDFSFLNVGYFLLHLEYVSRMFIGLYATILFGLIFGERLIMEIFLQNYQQRGFNALSILMVGSDHRAESILSALRQQRSWGHKIIGYLKPRVESKSEVESVPCLGSFHDFEKVITKQTVDEVVFALPSSETSIDLKPATQMCERMGVTYRIVPGMFDPESDHRVHVESIQNIPTLIVNMTKINPHGMLYKRMLDFSAGLAGTAVFAIMYPIVGLAIKLDSKGPILFRQKRVGQRGRIFSAYKFRTMNLNAEEVKQGLMAMNEMQGCMFKMQNDPRITRVGRFLRKTSLDEVPQFLNVLTGKMSVVGTRPPTVDEWNNYEHWQHRRIALKPGITGLWQVSGRNKITDFNEVVKLDLQYIDDWRFRHDLQIIFRTVLVVLQRKGAF